MPHDRRTFLKTAGLATAVVSAGPLALGMPGEPGPGRTQAAAGPRGFAAGHFALELDGKAAGVVAAYQGGNAVAEVIEETEGTDLIPQKSLGDIRYEEISIVAGFDMSTALWDWIGHMLAGEPSKMEGAIVFADASNNVFRRMEFHGALLTGLSFPALDAASKDVGKLMVTFRPESTVLEAATGKLPTGPVAKQKTWQTSNFRLKVGDLPCARVSKIEALTLKQNVTEYREGGDPTLRLLPGKLEIPNLVPTFSALDGGPWQSFFDKFALHGDGEVEELQGSLEFLGPDLKAVLATLQFINLGIFRLAPEEVDPSATNLQRFRADLYSEGNRLFVGGLN